MILYFTAVDRFGNEQKYSWWFSTMEFALDTLSSVCAKGKKVLNAQLIDNDQHIALPVAAFDGTSVSTPLQQLETQWQGLLDQQTRPERVRQLTDFTVIRPEANY